MTLDKALNALPDILLSNVDLGYQKTPADLLFMAETELSLFEEGEPETDIKSAKDLREVKAYIKMMRKECKP